MTDRLHRLLPALREHAPELDALLITCDIHVSYLTGFSGDSSWLLVTSDEHFIILSDRRYETQLEQECPTLTHVIRSPDQTLVTILEACIAKEKLRRIGIEGDSVSVATHRQWRANMPSVAWVETSGLVAKLRMIKDADEILVLRKAISIAERSGRRVTHQFRPTMTELDLAHELEATMRSLGAAGVSFHPIVGAHPNGALPHYRPGNVPLGDSPTLLIEWGALVDGYRSDLTRMLHRPEALPTHLQDSYCRAYDAVLEAQLSSIASIRAGVKASDVDAVARDVFQKAGLAQAFKHGLGHGIGREIHEGPRLSSLSVEVLEPGMVVTVEPGVYFEGEFGIRIEDDVLVTADGCVVLSELPKGLEDCHLVM